MNYLWIFKVFFLCKFIFFTKTSTFILLTRQYQHNNNIIMFFNDIGSIFVLNFNFFLYFHCDSYNWVIRNPTKWKKKIERKDVKYETERTKKNQQNMTGRKWKINKEINFSHFLTNTYFNNFFHVCSFLCDVIISHSFAIRSCFNTHR